MAKGSNSVKKRQRQNEKANVRNRSIKTGIKTSIKLVNTISKSKKKPEKSQESFIKLTSIVDRAKSKGILHKNKASRIKSRIAKFVNKTVSEKLEKMKKTETESSETN